MRAMRIVVGLLLAALVGCGGSSRDSAGRTSSPRPSGRHVLKLISGSENEALFSALDESGKVRKDARGEALDSDIVRAWEKDNDADIQVSYAGSVDIMQQIAAGKQCEYDIVCPAASTWITLGNEQSHIVKDVKAIQFSPLVYGAEAPLARELGWLKNGRPINMTAAIWLKAAESGKLRFAMTSATRSNSGNMAFLGFLYEFAGNPDVLTLDNLRDPKVGIEITRMLKSQHRTSGSSGWLKTLYVDELMRGNHPFNGLINYESMLVEMNLELVKRGRDPMIVFYPEGSLAIADSPLGYVDQGDAWKEKAFLSFQQYLLSQPIQDGIERLGRRPANQIGMKVPNPDPAVWNPEWGIDTTRVLSPFPIPDAPVLREAMNLYQTTFRKPSLTVWVLDYSGSMGENGGDAQLKEGMRNVLETDMARQHMLLAGPKDISVVIPFDTSPRNEGHVEDWTVRGNDPQKMRDLLGRVVNETPGGGTATFDAVLLAFKSIHGLGVPLRDYHTAIVVMTDGRANKGHDLPQVHDELQRAQLEEDIPVYAILFGDADPKQMNALASAFSGRTFDGTKNLVATLQEVQGYNR